jgi:hypothetical protein
MAPPARGPPKGAISQGLAFMVSTMRAGVSRAMRMSGLLGLGCAALALGGCALDRVYTGSFWVQPGKYDFLKCPDLARTSLADSNRERELVSLMERANQDTMGPVINVMVYQTELQQVRAELELLRQTAREKGCDNLVPDKGSRR